MEGRMKGMRSRGEKRMGILDQLSYSLLDVRPVAVGYNVR